MNFILEIPLQLLLSIGIVIVLPCLFTIYFRSTLYRKLVYLENRVRRLINRDQRGNQPEIVQELEARFTEASNELDRVNTIALIEQVYSKQKLGFVSYDQVEHICRVLPNLLLAFGLLGTFLGITLNLSELSSTISNFSNQDATDINNLLDSLKEPLKAIGIAFTTSLAGIFFSALITIVNLAQNTGAAKYKLFVAIEDYLDNIYQPQVQGNNRLDKAVDRLVFEFKEFLGRFGTTVRDAVESSLGAKIQEIVDVNQQANTLACQVYNSFYESAGTIAKGASDFQTYTIKFAETAQVFERSNFAQQLADATKDLYSIQKNFNNSTEVLAKSVLVIDTAVNELVKSNQQLQIVGENFNQTNLNTVQTLELHRQNQQSLNAIIPQLHHGSQGFQSAVETLDQIQQKAANKADSFDRAEQELKELTTSINKYNQVVTLGLKNFSDRLLTSVANQNETNKQQLQIIVDTLHHCNNHLIDTKHESYKLSKFLDQKFKSDRTNQNLSQHLTNVTAK